MVHQRDAMQHQLEHEIRKHQEETFKRQDQLKHHLEQATKHQNYLESTNEKMVQSTLELKDMLSGNLRIDEYHYRDLSSKAEFELSVKEMIQVKIYDILQPLVKVSLSLFFGSRHGCMSECCGGVFRR